MVQMLAATAKGPPGVSNLVVTAPHKPHRSAFSELLSELNPLQYLPVVGTIYRAITGDTISDEARTVGSLVMSGITGGPVGVAIGVATMAVEKVTGIDPEKLENGLLAAIGIGGAGTTTAQPAHPVLSAPEHGLSAIRAAAWSSAQLEAYGVSSQADGYLTQGNLAGSDVLNSLELARLGLPDRSSLVGQAGVSSAAGPSA